MESILTSVKKLLGIAAEYKDFDPDIIIHINSCFFTLSQLGVGPKAFTIADDSTTWDSYLPEGSNLEAVKSYIYLKVRLLFDPLPVLMFLRAWRIWQRSMNGGLTSN